MIEQYLKLVVVQVIKGAQPSTSYWVAAIVSFGVQILKKPHSGTYFISQSKRQAMHGKKSNKEREKVK